MARYSVGWNKVTAATANILIGQLRTTSTKDARIWEIGVFAGAGVANGIRLNRPSAVGATFTSSTPQAEDTSAGAATAVVDTLATTQPTLVTNDLRRADIAAVIGSGVIWTFPVGLIVPVSSAITLAQVSATATTYDCYIVYDE